MSPAWKSRNTARLDSDSVSTIASAALDVAGADIGPGVQQDRGEIALAQVAAAVEVLARPGEIARLDVAHGQRQPRGAVLRVARDEFLRQGETVGHVAVEQRGDEGALDQFEILRVGAQGFAGEGRGRQRIVLRLRHPGGEIIAGRAVADLEGVGQRNRFTRLNQPRAKEKQRNGQQTKAAATRRA